MSIQHCQINLSRRSLFKFSAGAIGTGVLTAGLSSNLLAAQKAPAEDEISPDKALQELLDGNERFAHRKRLNPHQTYSRLAEVAKGQKPFASILSCADS
ncbi:MAG: carbonic anhydrase, partial [Nostoc sp.]